MPWRARAQGQGCLRLARPGHDVERSQAADGTNMLVSLTDAFAIEAPQLPLVCARPGKPFAVTVVQLAILEMFVHQLEG